MQLFQEKLLFHRLPISKIKLPYMCQGINDFCRHGREIKLKFKTLREEQTTYQEERAVLEL